MELCEQLKRRGFTSESFYRTYHDMCSPPMLHLGSIESGDLWFSRHFDPIIACAGPRTLLVMYYPSIWSREKIANYFNEAYSWVCGSQSDPPSPEGGIKFAASENVNGQVTIHEYIRGDWAGYASRCPLPQLIIEFPSGWNESESTAG